MDLALFTFAVCAIVVWMAMSILIYVRLGSILVELLRLRALLADLAESQDETWEEVSHG